MKKALAWLTGSLYAAFVPVAALAQTYDDYDYNYNYDYDYSSGLSDTAAAGLGIGLIIFWIIFMIIALVFFIFWIMMLVDAVKRQWPERTTWLVILIVSFFLSLHWLSAIIYYFLVKRKNVGTKPGAAAPTAPAAK